MLDGTSRSCSQAVGFRWYAASLYELAQRSRIGKLPEAAALLARWPELLRGLMAEELPLTGDDMLRAGAFEWPHRNPFDRMLVTHAQHHGLRLVTKDAAVRALPGVACVEWAEP